MLFFPLKFNQNHLSDLNGSGLKTFDWAQWSPSQGITRGEFYIYISRKMAKVAWAFHGTCVKYLRPFDGQRMYIDFEYHSHISTTLNLILK